MNNITAVFWDRVNLHLTVDSLVEENVFLVCESGEAHPFTVNGNEASINITNLSQGEMLEEGRFYITCGNQKLTLSDDLIAKIDSLTKVFKYRAGFYALICEIGIEEDKSIFLEASYMMKNKKYKRFVRFTEGYGLIGKIETLIKLLRPVGVNAIYKMARLFKNKQQKNVFFYSENDNEPKGNLKALYEYFGGIEGINLKGQFFNVYASHSKLSTVKAIINIALSDIVVMDNYAAVLNFIDLEPDKQLIQLWHAGVGFKAVGYARFGKEGSAHPFKSSHRKYTCAIVDDERLVDVYKEVFAVPGDVFKPLGMPRLDGYLNAETINQVSENIFNEQPQLRNKKIILFSPTFRGAVASLAYYDYSQLNLDEIYDFCIKNDFAFVIKMHPFVKEKINIPQEYSQYILDCSHLDINSLIYISDIMVTDYSSCAYEFSFFDRPLVFFRYDKALYEYLRPMHTLDMFTSRQYEVTRFEDLMKVLYALKDVDVSKRFSCIMERKEKCCENIAKEILG